MTVEKIKEQINLNLKFYQERKEHLWSIRDKKIANSRKTWDNQNSTCSNKIQLLEEMLEFINGKTSLVNNFVNNK